MVPGKMTIFILPNTVCKQIYYLGRERAISQPIISRKQYTVWYFNQSD